MDSRVVERFEANRPRLASLAYRLLGSAADAEDAVQDVFLRWQAADRAHIEVPEAWLTKVVTNVSLDRLRSAQARRERAAGDWLPEPLMDGDPMLGPAESVEQRESVTMAVLLLMERLTPVERAVYVLREAFAYPHAEIAEILDITESASQQHAHRARNRVAAERGANPVDPVSAHRIVQAFVDAAASGRTDRLVALLTDDATAISDGAGLAKRLLRLAGPTKVAATIRAGFKPSAAKRRIAGGSPVFYSAVVNGEPAMVAAVDARVVGVLILTVRDGQISRVHGLANANRLDRVAEQWRHTHDDTPVVGSW